MMDASNGQFAAAAVAFASAGSFLAGYRWNREGWGLKIVSALLIVVALFSYFCAAFTK
jgi:hypothetical protein